MPQHLSLRRDDILLRLPAETEQLTRTQQSGLEVATLQSQTYNPVYGTCITISDSLSQTPFGGGAAPGAGDLCFFQIFTFSTAKDRAYGDLTNPQFANEYSPVTHFAFIYEGLWYMIIRASSLYFTKRATSVPPSGAEGAAITMLNNYTIASPVPITPLSNYQIIKLSNRDYELNQAIIQHTSAPWLTPGDHVLTLRYCDITLEEQYNLPILSSLVNGHSSYFIIESQNIIAILMGNKIKSAGPKRVVVMPDEIATTNSAGLIDMSANRHQPLAGTVIAVGPDCAAWNVGDKVLYARNSGMPFTTDDGDVLILADIDVFAAIQQFEPGLQSTDITDDAARFFAQGAALLPSGESEGKASQKTDTP